MKSLSWHSKIGFLFIALLSELSAQVIAPPYPQVLPEADKNAVQIIPESYSHILTAPSDLDVLHYLLEITVNPDQSTIQGHTTLTAQLPPVSSRNAIVLDLVSLEIDSIQLNKNTVPFSYGGWFIVIDFPPAFDKSSAFLLDIWYQGSPQNDGFGGFFFSPEVIYTVGEGIYTDPPSMARYWFPCHDIPDDKATLEVKITVPGGLQAISNGRMIASTTQGDWHTFHWQEIHPIAPYLIALAISNYVSYSVDYFSSKQLRAVPIEFYVYPELLNKARVDFANVNKMMSFFEQAFGPYSFDRYSMVAAPMRGAMEHQTMTTYSDVLIDGTGNHDDIIAHELAHHWWGNSVTLSDWREIWLNEGFASYSEALYAEAQKGQEALKERMSRFRSRYISEVNLRGAFPIYDPDNMWTATVYDKGAWVLHMLRWLLGDEDFNKTLKTYAEQYRYGNATIKDFQRLAEGISSQSLEKFLNQWLKQPGHPELEISWDILRHTDGQLNVLIEASQVQKNWPIFEVPMEIRLTGHAFSRLDTLFLSHAIDTFYVPVPESPISLDIDPDEWLLKTFKIKSTPLPPGFLPGEYALAQNYPNPFNQSTTITIQVGNRNKPEKIKLTIRDLIGRKMLDLVDEKISPGIYSFTWNGKDKQGKPAPSGIYFYHLQAGEFHDTRQMVLIR